MSQDVTTIAQFSIHENLIIFETISKLNFSL